MEECERWEYEAGWEGFRITGKKEPGASRYYLLGWHDAREFVSRERLHPTGLAEALKRWILRYALMLQWGVIMFAIGMLAFVQ